MREPGASEGRRAATLRQSFLGFKLANTQRAVSGADHTPHTFCESLCFPWQKTPNLSCAGHCYCCTSATSRISFHLGRRGVPRADHQPVHRPGT